MISITRKPNSETPDDVAFQSIAKILRDVLNRRRSHENGGFFEFSHNCRQPGQCFVWIPNGTCLPDVESANAFLNTTEVKGSRRLIVVSSAAVYGAHHHNMGLITEDIGTRGKDDNEIATAWQQLEQCFRDFCTTTNTELTVLRLASVDCQSSPLNLITRYKRIRRTVGLNPTVQVLSIRDVSSAIQSAVDSVVTGTFNIAPTETALLSEVAKQHRKRDSVARPELNHRAELDDVQSNCLRFVPTNNSANSTQKPTRLPRTYFCYSWTVSGEKAYRELGFQPQDSTLDNVSSANKSAADSFGMSTQLINMLSRFVFWFFEKCYWRIEVRGLENIPANGAAVLTGVHRGFMPFDGVMLVHLLNKRCGRIPRFLIHPALVKFPFIATLMSRLGGVIANQENASRILNSNQILSVFPEGIRGAFTMYKDAHRIGRHWRDDYARFAIEHDVPVIPFAIVGTAETFPIFGKIKWLRKLTEWPFLPITSPFPLPAKWHIEILPPVNPAGSDPKTVAKVVKTVGAQQKQSIRETDRVVQNTIQLSMDRMVKQRPSWFFGSAFPRSTTTASHSANRSAEAQQLSVEQQVV